MSGRSPNSARIYPDDFRNIPVHKPDSEANARCKIGVAPDTDWAKPVRSPPKIGEWIRLVLILCTMHNVFVDGYHQGDIIEVLQCRSISHVPGAASE
jgi:hypothetical protein